MGYNTTTMNKPLLQATIWMNFTNIMLREKNQTRVHTTI